jgi:murein DD-endopeptidase MepM/ murein hydrolase activator NlpD
MPEHFFSLPETARIVGKPGSFAVIDLSSARFPDGISNAGLHDYLTKFISESGGAVPYGGYREKRTLYDNFEAFDGRQWHLGIDIWAEAGTPVMAALAGKVHSFAYNAGAGNYGPTIILEHRSEGRKFYTLYGHLDVGSIEALETGQSFTAGQAIGHLGDETVNGGYLPHLHFQVIYDLEGHAGDYPGVCSQADLPRYLGNCPDPNLLLQLT